MKEFLTFLSLKKYEINIFISYEVIRTNVKRHFKSVKLIYMTSLSCNSSVTNKDIELIFLKAIDF